MKEVIEIKEVISTIAYCRAVDIKNSDRFEEDLDMDSLDHVEMIMAIDELYSIEIPDNKANLMLTVGDLIEYLTEQGLVVK